MSTKSKIPIENQSIANFKFQQILIRIFRGLWGGALLKLAKKEKQNFQ
jgi:hypothetical protein